MFGEFVTVQKTRLVNQCAFCNSKDSYKNGVCEHCGAIEEIQVEEKFLTQEYVYSIELPICKQSEIITETLTMEEDNKKSSRLNKKTTLALLCALPIMLVIMFAIIFTSQSTYHCDDCGHSISYDHPLYAYRDNDNSLHYVSENYKEMSTHLSGLPYHEVICVIHCDNCNKIIEL